MTIALPPIIILGLAVSIGIFMGLRYLRGEANRPVVIGLHLLCAAGGLEALAMVMRGTPSGTAAQSNAFSMYGAGLVVAALLCGLVSQVLHRQYPRAGTVLLATHATFGAAGFAALLIWLAQT